MFTLKSSMGLTMTPGESADFRKPKVRDFGKSKNKTFDNQNSRLSESKSADFRESKCNNTEISDTEKSYTDLSETDPIISHHGGSSSPSGEISDTIRWMEERNCYERIIKNNIDYDIIVEQYGKAWLDEIVNCFSVDVCFAVRRSLLSELTMNENIRQEVVKSGEFSDGVDEDGAHGIRVNFCDQRKRSQMCRNTARAFTIATIYRAF